MNQETIYEAGRALAREDGTQIMLVVGADWCSSCRHFEAMIAEDENRQTLFERVTLVNVNGMLSSTRELVQRLGVSYRGFPQAFIIDANSEEVQQQFFPSMFYSVEAMISNLNLEARTQTLARPTQVGSVNVSTLELPIELMNDYGTSDFIENPQSRAQRYVNQGVAALHVFHYVDAYRSFRAAAQANSQELMAYIGQILSILQIDTGENGFYFVNQARNQIRQIEASRALTESERAWVNFVQSFIVYYSDNYVFRAGESILPLQQAYADVLEKDARNLDGQALITWLSISMVDYGPAQRLLEAVLEEKPNNAGAHHYLLHIAEAFNDIRKADAHAVQLIRLAPGSAHAQHMYGHTLPQRGRWQDALDQFQLAHDIHLRWAERNGVAPQQDWHYSHNLDLMAAAYLGLGNFERARQAWEQAAEFDTRARLHALQLAVVSLDRDQAHLKLLEMENLSSGWAEYLRPLRNELELTQESLRRNGVSIPASETSQFSGFMRSIQERFLAGEPVGEPLTSEITRYLADRFISGGFDGWSNAYLELLRLKRVARILGMNQFLEDLQPLEFTVQSGSLCGSQPQRGAVPCRE